MSAKDYRRRDVVDKLGIKPGHAVGFGGDRRFLGAALRSRILAQVGRPVAEAEEPCDVVLVGLDDMSDAVAELTLWRARLRPNGGIWLLTAKRGQPGYVDQRELIAAGVTAGLVDNKVCSVSDTINSLRFVIRRKDRTRT